MAKEEPLKTYLEEKFSYIERRLSQIETQIAALPRFLDKFGNAMGREVKSLEKSVDVFEKRSKAESKEMGKLIQKITGPIMQLVHLIAKWKKAMEEETRTRKEYNKTLSRLVDELERE